MTYRNYFILLLPLLALLEAFFYIYDWHILPTDGADWVGAEDTVTIHFVAPESPAELAGLQVGDKILSVDGESAVWHWSGHTLFRSFRAGQTVTYEVLRGAERLRTQVTLVSVWSIAVVLFIGVYVIALLIIITGVYVFLKKPSDLVTGLFLVYTTIIALQVNVNIIGGGEFGILRGSVLSLATPFLGITVLHFSLVFPNPVWKPSLRRATLRLLYSIAGLLGIALSFSFVLLENWWDTNSDHLMELSVKASYALTMPLLVLSLAVTIRRLSREVGLIAKNQIRWLMIGIFLSAVPFAFMGGTYVLVTYYFGAVAYNPVMLQGMFALSFFLLTVCVAFAILRYRLWDIEVIIKRSLLYAGTTVSVVGLYAIIHFVALSFLDAARQPAQFIGLLGSALLIVPAQRVLRKPIDQMFHREGYEPTDVIFRFNRVNVGVYDEQHLLENIPRYLDSVFHFSFFRLAVRRGSTYVMASPVGGESISVEDVTPETQAYLQKSRPFSVKELQQPQTFLPEKAELVVPLRYQEEDKGFIVCGRKKSEKVYSAQDIQLLAVLAQRTAAMMKTVELYQMELDRQLSLERERSRISQDLHDDIGARLTELTLSIQLLHRDLSNGTLVKDQLQSMSDAIRVIVESFDEIVWMWNPENDTLENVATALSHYASKYLSTAGIRCRLDIPTVLPDRRIPAEIRHNILMVVKEAIHNIVKHAEATEVSLHVCLRDSVLEVIVCDNGRGFADVSGSPFSDGLRNMRKRMEEVGGRFWVTSQPSEGTQIRIAAPLGEA